MNNTPKPSTPSVMPLLLKKLKQLMASPYGVAAIASLSFHGVLFAAIPRFSSASFAAFSEDNATSESRTVPLVTLSAAEQERLPNFNPPRLPSVPEFPSSSTRTSTSTSIRNLPRASTLTPRPSIFDRYSGSRTTPPPITQSRRRFNNPYNIPIINTPSRSEQSKTRREEPIAVPPPPTDTLDTELEIEERLEAEAEQVETSPREQTNTPEGLPELPENSGEVLEPENSDIAANSEVEREPTQLERLQAKFHYSAENTTEDEVKANYEKWEAPLEEEDSPAIVTAEPGELQIESGLSLCVENPPENGEVGVLVAPDGTPGDATVLRSTGYEYLNQAALDAITASDFPETDIPVRYPFAVVVGYDSETCQSSENILNTVQNTEQTSSDASE